MRLKIFNGQIITPHRLIPNGIVVVEDGKIMAVSGQDIEVRDAIEIDANGDYISPGFIDIHVHGGGGCSFMDGNADDFLRIAEAHAKYGTTALYPTTLTATKEDLLKILDSYEEANKKNIKGAQFMGIHLEGPYIAMNQAGAQDRRYIRNPDPKEYEEIIAHSDSVRRWSFAPELKGAVDFARYLRSKGIIAALAHTDAVFEEGLEAFENGCTLATHFYSAMLGVTRRKAFRYAGIIELGYLLDEMDVEIIADGIHLPMPLLKLIYKIKGADRTALITDAMRASGTDDHKSILGSRENGISVIIEDGVAKLTDRTGFAGSIATTDRLVRTMINVAEVPLVDTIKMMTSTPARIMGIANTKGSLTVGKDADIVIFDNDINIKKTIVGGTVIYDSTDKN